MKRIGLLSDTHGYWDERYVQHFAECDEVWHAGDIGSLEVAEQFEAFRPFRAVYGKEGFFLGCSRLRIGFFPGNRAF